MIRGNVRPRSGRSRAPTRSFVEMSVPSRPCRPTSLCLESLLGRTPAAPGSRCRLSRKSLCLGRFVGRNHCPRRAVQDRHVGLQMLLRHSDASGSQPRLFGLTAVCSVIGLGWPAKEEHMPMRGLLQHVRAVLGPGVPPLAPPSRDELDRLDGESTSLGVAVGPVHLFARAASRRWRLFGRGTGRRR